MRYKVALTKLLYYPEIEVEARDDSEAAERAKNIFEDEELIAKRSAWGYSILEKPIQHCEEKCRKCSWYDPLYYGCKKRYVK